MKVRSASRVADLTKAGVDYPAVEAWIEALESGEYLQASGMLRAVINPAPKEAIGYCCLGVMCNLIKPEWAVSDPDAAYPEYTWADGGDLEFPPAEVTVRYGLTHDGEPEIEIGFPEDEDGVEYEGWGAWEEGADHWTSLANANDGGISFATIARWLRFFYGLAPKEETDVRGE